MRERKEHNNGNEGRWGYRSRFGWNHSTITNSTPRRPKRNGSVNSRTSGGNPGGIAIRVLNPKWYAYRITIIAISAATAFTGLSLFIAECVR